MIDLRSDTVTRPTPQMRRAMFEAQVGDDDYGEDPTVNLLQKKVAELLGKQDSIFVPSGTMANQLCVKAHTLCGDEVVVEKYSHIFNHEVGAASALAGVQLCPVEGERGIIYSEQIEEVIRSGSHTEPPTRLICVENTHNEGGGSIYPTRVIEEISKLAKKYSLSLHMDGARLLNATVASGKDPVDYTKHVDSVSLCLSKGLGAPVGSMIAGTKDFIRRVRRLRKMYGGGMRQTGLLAAAGIYALDNHVQRLVEDHKKAKRLAGALAEIPGVNISPEEVETNIIYFGVEGKKIAVEKIEGKLREKGVLVLPVGDTRFRAVTHLDVSIKDIEQAILVFREVLH